MLPLIVPPTFFSRAAYTSFSRPPASALKVMKPTRNPHTYISLVAPSSLTGNRCSLSPAKQPEDRLGQHVIVVEEPEVGVIDHHYGIAAGARDGSERPHQFFGLLFS